VAASGTRAGEGGCSPTQDLAAVCSTFSYDQIPAATQTHAKHILLDTLGAMLAASQPSYPGLQRLSRYVHDDSMDGPCMIVGTDLCASPTNAALVNGYLGYALDIETLHSPSIMHAAAVVVPAALAVAEQEASRGADLLAALVLGVEIACRVSLAIGPTDLYARGFHPTAVAGSFGAAAAASLLLRQDTEQIERSFGLAATQTGGLLAWADDESEESRPFNPGIAARNGVTASRLATLGFGAPRGVFDATAKYSVFRAWSTDGVGAPSRMLDRFGDTFAIDELTVKQYACCGFLHPALDGLLAILRSERLVAAEIAAITIRFPSAGAPIIDNNPLRSHRAQYILPLAAVRGMVLFDDVIRDQSTDGEIRRLSEVTRFIPDDAFDQYYPERFTTEIAVTTRRGVCHRLCLEWAKGTPENPMTNADIVEKFHHLVGSRIDELRANQIVALAECLDRSPTIDELARALRVP
jgi:2-methylcitrate dehydratase PrpD